jgi:DNA helicase II / ATP-dependent DNA helicase PcrA
MDRILDGLNEEQKFAVISKSPVLQVLAPPGSGKTKTLTARVAHLIESGHQPWNIIVCTFTIKAAREMRERIKNFVGEQLQSKLVLGTFHSVARRYLMFYGHHIGISKNFGIADSSDTLNIIKRLIKKHKFNLEPGRCRTRISKKKSSQSKDSKPESQPRSGRVGGGKLGGFVSSTNSAYNERTQLEQQEFDDLYIKYEETLRLSNLLDYDDLLARCVELLKTHPECVANIEAVLIDEFQDTNNVQYDLMSLFAQHSTNRRTNIPVSVTIVGDPDQSIYSFRNAEIKNLGRMREQYLDHQVINLEQNYRSSASILKFAMAVIEQDESRHSKTMRPTHSSGSMPVMKTLPDAELEASWLVGEIKRLKGFSGGVIDYTDFAILLRSAHLSQKIESQLGQEGIPYRMVGGSKFFDRVEVKILVDYLRVIVAPDHTEALSRVVNIPPRGIGDKTIQYLVNQAEDSGLSLWKLLYNIATGKDGTLELKLSSPAKKGIDQFVDVILDSQKKLDSVSTGDCLSKIIGHLIQKLSFYEWLKRKCEMENSDFESRCDNIDELRRLASSIPLDGSNLEERLAQLEDIDQVIPTGSHTALNEFLANIALATEKQEDETGSNKVTISTIHAAKGLEWPVVFVPACYDGSMPHSRAEDIDEERRLLFVAMTRAKALLYISRPDKYGGFNNEPHVTAGSRFLADRSMRKYFGLQGPSMCVSVIKEVANILCRECPSDHSLTELFASLNYQEDDISEGDIRLDPSLSRFEDHGSAPDVKRRKISGFSNASGLTYQRTSKTFNETGHSVSKTALQNGFVNASSLKRDFPADSRFNDSNQRAPSRVVGKEKGLKKPKPGQGTLSRFGFSQGSIDGNERSREEAKPNPSLGRQSKQSLATVTNSLNAHQSSSVQMANSFMDRNVRVGSAFSWTHPETGNEGGKYILLSSSPTRPDNDKESSHGGQIVDAQSMGRTSLHTTTMDQLANRQTHARRVYRLGATRRANG